jgi:alginate O-acetyltransferase complex protein AlgI
MAIGLAHMLGFKLAKNFDLPYLAANFSEFWGRWHITLSTWLRDYVYTPLGGGRGSRLRRDFNLWLTMTLCGLWHGANWNFVFFGAVHGCLLVLHRRFREATVSKPKLRQVLDSSAGNALCVAATFVTFGLTAVIFRNPSLEQGFTMLRRMLVMSSGSGNPMNDRALWYTVIFVAACQAVAALNLHQRIGRLPAPVQGFAYASSLTLALLLHPELGKAFVYFQF